MASQSIFERIGGRDAVEAVVSDFYDRVLDDPVLQPYFEDTDMQELYSHQTQFISAVAGGPVDYDGGDMETAHEGLGITEDAFAKVATHLEAALRANGVPDDDVEAILTEVAAMEDDIVEA
ncbi:group 1 truncated hemoglobin [Haloarcula sp. CBA1130]|uniref:group I truncated hemoglobin n=1 Tax=unclassified Haloarcula TaxID=2624677 RepID=UPI001248A13D|nr:MULTISPECIES: group 1 truncated hemoglobin [unclassified Haloarcula]KAA9399392.1 group 1 truncated hemoglobin [Haloarcula sp. CBA1129]KAA9403907.1 group 1 truncated hemoglobin [Haloarcula sp. CBA1130]